MKATGLLLSALLAQAPLSLFAQGSTGAQQTIQKNTGLFASQQPILFVQSVSGIFILTNHVPRLPRQFQVIIPSALSNLTAQTSPKPGVYQTFPFTSLLVVPGSHPDDRSCVAPKEKGSSMPVMKPELHLLSMVPQ